MTWRLWLDDQYDEPDMIFRHPPLGFISCRSSSEATVLTLEKGLPEYISFDHDLGDNDTSINYINFLIENYFDEVVPDYTVHSANPIGKANIISKMESWKKAQGIK